MGTVREGEGPDFVEGVGSVGGLRRDGKLVNDSRENICSYLGGAGSMVVVVFRLT